MCALKNTITAYRSCVIIAGLALIGKYGRFSIGKLCSMEAIVANAIKKRKGADGPLFSFLEMMRITE